MGRKSVTSRDAGECISHSATLNRPENSVCQTEFWVLTTEAAIFQVCRQGLSFLVNCWTPLDHILKCINGILVLESLQFLSVLHMAQFLLPGTLISEGLITKILTAGEATCLVWITQNCLTEERSKTLRRDCKALKKAGGSAKIIRLCADLAPKRRNESNGWRVESANISECSGLEDVGVEQICIFLTFSWSGQFSEAKMAAQMLSMEVGPIKNGNLWYRATFGKNWCFCPACPHPSQIWR